MIDMLPGAVWLRRNWEELRHYNFQWIATAGDRIDAHGEDLERVMDEIVEQGLAEQAVYAFVDFDEEERVR